MRRGQPWKKCAQRFGVNRSWSAVSVWEIPEGYSLIEVTVVLALIAVLAGISVPSFASLLRENRLATVANELLAAITFTRSEAIKRGRRVTLCTSSNLTDCESNVGWHAGWIVFEDGSAEGARNEGQRLLLATAGSDGAAPMTGNRPVRDYVSYVPQGATRMLNGALQMGTITICDDGHARQIVISASGRPRVVRAIAC